MKVPLEWAMGTVRFSVGRQTTILKVDQTVEIVADAVKRQQIVQYRVP
jgi:cysteine desulfurase